MRASTTLVDFFIYLASKLPYTGYVGVVGWLEGGVTIKWEGRGGGRLFEALKKIK